MTSAVQPVPTERSQLLARLSQTTEADLVIIGGGATGLGVALDAVLRGLSVVLLEAHDFAKGTSSRATKLVHGGVRYLAQGNLSLVRQALLERKLLLANAPHLAGRLPFIMPAYSCWETPFYGAGLKMYDALAGRDGLGGTRFLSAQALRQRMPGVREQGLKGGVSYWDGQFDDARLALALARTAAAQGALMLNYCPVDELIHDHGRVAGVHCHDAESGVSYTVRAKAVVNASGVWVDRIRQLDGQAAGITTQNMVVASQGVHLVVDQHFLPGTHALLVPRTDDKRVLFAVPWLGKLILGTTDTERDDLPQEPSAQKHEVDFILTEAAKYLATAPTRNDVRSIWAGLRPLVRPPSNEPASSSTYSREHSIQVSPTGLLTVTGGKWTTYRAMAEDVLDHCVKHMLLPRLPGSRTARFPLVGAWTDLSIERSLVDTAGMASYGTEAPWVTALGALDDDIVPGLTPAMVRFAVRYEYARTVEDVLARRSRILFLDASAAAHAAPQVAALIQSELDRDPEIDEFLTLAQSYQSLPVPTRP